MSFNAHCAVRELGIGIKFVLQRDFKTLLPDKVEDEIRQWSRPLKTYHNRRHEDGEL